MLDLAHICAIAIRAVYWLVVLACNFLGYSPVWVKNEWKRRQQEEFNRSMKVPNHLAVTFSDQCIRKSEICAFIDCCLAVGIRRVTMYDPFGELRKISDSLKIIGKAKNIHIFNNSPCPIGDYRLIVQILPYNFGRRSLVESCKIVTKASEAVSVNNVSSVLADNFGLTEPELLIQVGHTPSLAGYPPWTLRITEFVQVWIFIHFSNFRFGLYHTPGFNLMMFLLALISVIYELENER